MHTSFLLTWCPPPVEATNGPITAYILEYGESSGETPQPSVSLSGVVEEHTVTGLKPHTEYYVKVAAVNAAGRGPFCEPVLVQTAPDSECRSTGICPCISSLVASYGVRMYIYTLHFLSCITMYACV